MGIDIALEGMNIFGWVPTRRPPRKILCLGTGARSVFIQDKGNTKTGHPQRLGGRIKFDGAPLPTEWDSIEF
jgi:hypothetical protein